MKIIWKAEGQPMKEKKDLFLIITNCLLIVAIIGTIFAWCNRTSNTQTQKNTLISDELQIHEKKNRSKEETTIRVETIEDRLHDMGFLVTQEYYFTELVSFSKVEKFLKTDINLPFTKSSYLASYSGVVPAGIDFTKITVEQDNSSKKVLIYLPTAETKAPNVDPSSFLLYSEKNAIGNPLSASDFNKSLTELENSAAKSATEKGVLEQATKNAKTVIDSFIKSLSHGGLRYEIVTEEERLETP